MGQSAKRKPKAEANLQDDAVLGELLGEIKSSKPTTKTEISKHKKVGHSNPFATAVVRPASTGIKREAKRPKIEIKAEIPDETALSQMIDDDEDFSQMDFDEPMIEAETPTQQIEDDEATAQCKIFTIFLRLEIF